VTVACRRPAGDDVTVDRRRRRRATRGRTTSGPGIRCPPARTGARTFV